MDAQANFAYSLVVTPPSPATTGTTLDITASTSSRFPAVPFNAVIWPTSAQPLASNAEIVRVTVNAGDNFTITRQQEGTSARTVVAGDQVAAMVTNKTLTDLRGEVSVMTDETVLLANVGAIVVEEYVMDATHELVFTDPSELVVMN